MADIRDQITGAVAQLKSSLEERESELLSQLYKIEDAAAKEKPCGTVTDRHTKKAVFTWDHALEETCKSFGHVCFSSVCASRCTAVGDGVRRATVDEAAVVSVRLFNKDGTCCVDEVPVSLRLLDPHGEYGVRGEQQRREDNVVTFKYVPKEPGIWQLHVDVLDGRPISDSPFDVRVRRLLRQHFHPITSITNLARPMGLAISLSTGDLVVVENKGWSTISVYSQELKHIRSFASWGSGRGECKQPRGVCFDPDDNILVVDGENNRLHKFSPDGQLLQTVGSTGFGLLEFRSPVGVTCSPHGLVYVADRSNHRIQILRSSDLSFKSTFGRQGCGPGDLYNPWDVAVDTHGNVYVTDTGHSCVKKFTSHGEFIQQISSHGSRGEDLKCPTMICIDKNSYLYVTDRQSNKLSVFDPFGEFYMSVGIQGGSGADLGQFREPTGVAVRENGLVYVSELYNNRVQVLY